MPPIDLWIRRSLRRLHFGQFLQSAAEWLAVFLCVFGTAVLCVKLLAPAAWPNVLWLASAVAPVTLGAWWISRHRNYSRMESVALLERRMQTGGLLMTLSELPDSAWQERLPQVEAAWVNSLPKVRPVRFAKTMLGPMAFAVAACFVPLREIPAEPILPNQAGKTASNQLEETLAVLEEAKVLEPEEQEKLKEEIEKLAEEAKHQPLTHEKWETIDALRERLKLRLDSAELSVSKASHAVNSLKQALQQAGVTLTPEQEAALEEEAIETLRKLQKRSTTPGKQGKGTKGSSDALQRLMKNGKLSDDPKDREEELQELDDFLKSECEKLGKCRGKCQGGNNGDGPDGEGEPGRGGINRGRGDAELTFGDDSSEEGTKFKEVVLPPGFLDQPGEEVVQVTPTAPDEKPAADAPRGTARNIDSASGNEAVSRQMRPRHKQIIKDYFNSKK